MFLYIFIQITELYLFYNYFAITYIFLFTEITILKNLCNINFRRAYSMVQQRRFCINPNEGFMTQLREYEPIYQAEKTVRNDQQSSESQRSVKRTIHQIETDNRTQVENAMDS